MPLLTAHTKPIFFPATLTPPPPLYHSPYDHNEMDTGGLPEAFRQLAMTDEVVSTRAVLIAKVMIKKGGG